MFGDTVPPLNSALARFFSDCGSSLELFSSVDVRWEINPGFDPQFISHARESYFSVSAPRCGRSQWCRCERSPVEIFQGTTVLNISRQFHAERVTCCAAPGSHR